MTRQFTPLEQIIGRRSRPDPFGTLLGWAICAAGLLAVTDAWMFYLKHGFLWTLAPSLAGFGLILAICGWGLAKRRVFSLWLTGAIAFALILLVLVDLSDPGSRSGWLPTALFSIFVAVSVFGYFFWIRHEFARAK